MSLFHVINDRPVSLINLLAYLLTYLLIRIPSARCLVAGDCLVSMVWCKHEFQRRRSNFNGKFERI